MPKVSVEIGHIAINRCMTKIKTLVIFVADYPSGNGEPFLEEELKVLEQNFEKIYLLQTLINNGPATNKDNFYTPKNATVINLYSVVDKLSFFKKIILFLQFRFIYEFALARFKHKVPFSIGLIKQIFYYWPRAHEGKKGIENFINSRQINLNETTFYSYWCDEHAIALAIMKRKISTLNFVTRLHGWDLYFERHRIPFLPFREFIFNKASKILSISNDGRKYILDKKLSILSNKIITSRLGVSDLLINVSYRSEADLPVNKKVLHILSLSSVIPVKRLDKLINALKQISSFDIHWHHIGNGTELYESVIKQLAEHELNRRTNISYTFHGYYSKAQVLDFLQNVPIDVIINCSDSEGIPVSIMEAMSAGIPAIAYDVGGIPGILINEETGILLKSNGKNEKNKVEELKNAIEKFYHFPVETRLKFSKNAKSMWNENYNALKNYEMVSNILGAREFKAPIIYCKQCLIGSDVYPDISINKYGICDVCGIIQSKTKKIEEERISGYLPALLNEIRSNKGNKKYDCILGISGGVDSAYLAVKAKEYGLNPLLVHIDNGWNSETAVKNLKILIEQLGFDLYTVVIDWNEIKDLVRSFFKAGVIDIDWANEMCFQAALYQVAFKFRTKYILIGHQVATEGWMPDNVVHYKLDLINFKYIHKKFGDRKLKMYPMQGFLKNYFYETILGIKYYFPLDYIDYNKDAVKKELIEKYGWRDYGQKHFENIFTRFYQGYILPVKFKIDKRRFHYSSLILSGQLTKQEAQDLINSNAYIDSLQMLEDKEYVIKKLEFSKEEFEQILKNPPKKHTDYPSIINIVKKARVFKRKLEGN